MYQDIVETQKYRFYQIPLNFNFTMIKKEEHKKQKMIRKQEQKNQKNLKKATKRPNQQGDAPQAKDKPITKQKLETLPTIASMLATPAEERQSKAAYVLPSVLPFLINYINKKQGSRVVELLVKWGDQRVKKQIFDVLKENWKDLIRGKYSIFVLKQLVGHVNLPDLVQEAVTMQGIKQAAAVLDRFIKKTANGTQIQQMKQAFRNLAESGDDKDQETLDNLVMKIIEKEYSEYTLSKYILTIAMKNLVQTERDKVLAYLQPRMLTLINDNEGLRLFCQVVNYSSPKDRKTILKQIKPEVCNIIESQNHNSYIALLKLLHTVDDTVLLEKNILSQLEPYWPTLYENKKIANILYSLFSPVRNNFNIMGKWQSPNHFSTSKKSDQDRAGEIREKIIGKTIQALNAKSINEALTDLNVVKLVGSVIRYILIENFSEENFAFVKQVMNTFIADTKKLYIKAKEVFEQNSLICHLQAHRVLKTFITLYQQAPAPAEDFLLKSISKIQQYLLQDLPKTLATKSSYILIAIIENTNDKDHILSMVRKSGVNLEKAVGGNIYLHHYAIKN